MAAVTDPRGNKRTIVQGTSTTASYTYDSANRVTAACYGTTTCTGAERAVRYEYDLRDRMTSATVAGITTELSYDALGNRIAATRGSETTTSRWDINNPLPRLAVQLRPDGSPDRSYRTGPGGTPVMTRAGTTNQYYAHDWIGSVRDVFPQQGEQQYSYDYEPFGGTRNTQQHAESASSNPLRFTGAYRDDTLGLHNLRDRQYRAETGRFTSTDPATPRADEPQTSTYAYAADRPGVAVDPSGRCWWISGSGESSCPGFEALSGVGEGLHAVGSATLRGLAATRGGLPLDSGILRPRQPETSDPRLRLQRHRRHGFLGPAGLGTLGINSFGGASAAPGVSGLPLSLREYKLDRDHNFPAVIDNHEKTGIYFKIETKKDGGVFPITLICIN